MVGHEWKSLVENSRTAEDPASQNNTSNNQQQQPRGGTPTSFANNNNLPKNNSNSNFQDGQHSANGPADGSLYKAGSNEALLGEEDYARDRERTDREKDSKQAPRWQGEIKIDILKELEDVASMTIAETGFFCK